MLRTVRRNLRHARLDLPEVSGAFGDMGTFVPLLVGLVGVNGMPFVSSLFFAGLFNFVTGLLYPIPMAVQPMKAIAAIALTERLAPDEIVAAGLVTSVVVLLLGVSGGIHVVHRVVPKVVVRGLQLGIGLALAQRGAGWALGVPLTEPMGLFVLASLALILVNMRFAFPAALAVFSGGLAWELLSHPALPVFELQLSFPALAFPAVEVLPVAAGVALAQLPLTTLNSVISVVVLSRDLFPGLSALPGVEGQPVTLRKVSVTVGLMNVVGSLFGALPMCHGAGGLAGQYRFGARTNGSILFLGMLKMLTAVLLGLPLFHLIKGYPQEILGVLLLAAGLELALSGRRITTDGDFHLVLLTAVTILVKGTLFGVLLGTAAYWFLWVLHRSRGEGDDLGQ